MGLPCGGSLQLLGPPVGRLLPDQCGGYAPGDGSRSACGCGADRLHQLRRRPGHPQGPVCMAEETTEFTGEATQAEQFMERHTPRQESITAFTARPIATMATPDILWAEVTLAGMSVSG